MKSKSKPGPVPPEGAGLWGQGHMSKGMIYIFVAGILVDTSLCFWCLGASNLHVDLVFVIFYYCGVSPIRARSNFNVAPSQGSRQKNLLELFQGSTVTGVTQKEYARAIPRMGLED